MAGHAIGGLAGLPSGTERSCIALRDQRGRLTVYTVLTETSQQTRLRRAVDGAWRARGSGRNKPPSTRYFTESENDTIATT